MVALCEGIVNRINKEFSDFRALIQSFSRFLWKFMNVGLLFLRIWDNTTIWSARISGKTQRSVQSWQRLQEYRT